jgi:hypothetical protein
MAVPALRHLYLDALLECGARVTEPDRPQPPLTWIEAYTGAHLS